MKFQRIWTCYHGILFLYSKYGLKERSIKIMDGHLRLLREDIKNVNKRIERDPTVGAQPLMTRVFRVTTHYLHTCYSVSVKFVARKRRQIICIS